MLKLRPVLPALLCLIAVGCSAAEAQTSQTVRDRASEVDPLIGTANGGNVFPGATLPFGMVQFSPEASPNGAKRPIASPGGYEDRSTQIRGFSLTHVEGWGCAGGSGDVPVMPVTEEVRLSPSTDYRRAYAASFTHADEVAQPGLYRVKLGNGVAAAMAGLWFAGSFGVVARGGAATGWVAKQYDEMYRLVPVIGKWL